ncbi:unnamed protein product [Amoebophrya sp. A120]|nr:unnamed protein product [Amoebophrya sp. A120]|eukprot:GSA120T00012390001.1
MIICVRLPHEDERAEKFSSSTDRDMLCILGFPNNMRPQAFFCVVVVSLMIMILRSARSRRSVS